MFLEELDREMAQKIANGIMNIVPYNINIMDKRGVIIASGDPKRLSTLHAGAVKALELVDSYVVYEDTETERKGVNIPILYNGHIVGVIGVSGNPNEVMQVGRIVVVTAQLMIENQLFNDVSAVREGRLKDFLYDWIYLSQEEYHSDFLNRAKYFGSNLALPRTAVIFTSKKVRFGVIDNIKRQLLQNEYVVRQRMEDVLVLFSGTDKLDERLKRILKSNDELLHCYVGEETFEVSSSVQRATQAMNTAQALGLRDKIIHFESLSLEYLLGAMERTTNIEEIKNALKSRDTGGELSATIRVYTETTHDIPMICERLHIHRNTLNYRLSKIEELTGRNPRCTRDLMELYIAVIQNLMC